MNKELKIHLTISFLVMVAFALNSSSFAAQSLKEVLSKPGIAEQLQANYAGRTTYDGQQDTPLVIQARKFALRINPPPPPEPVRPRQENAPVRPQVEISAKFKLIGTSYHFGDQTQSWALVDEVGKGLHWVKQGGKVGYLNIEKVGDGGVLINDNGKRYELLAERQSKPDVVKSYSGTLDKLEPIVLLDKSQIQQSAPSAESMPTEPEAVQPQEPVAEGLTPEEQLKQTQASIEWLKQMQNDPNSAGMSASEANEMAAFGDMLNALQEESQRLQTETASDANKPDSNSLQPKTDNILNNPQPSQPSPPAVAENRKTSVIASPNELSQQSAWSKRIRNKR